MQRELKQLRDTQNSIVLKEIDILKRELQANREMLTQQQTALTWIREQMMKTAEFIQAFTTQQHVVIQRDVTHSEPTGNDAIFQSLGETFIDKPSFKSKTLLTRPQQKVQPSLPDVEAAHASSPTRASQAHLFALPTSNKYEALEIEGRSDERVKTKATRKQKEKAKAQEQVPYKPKK